ncbi:type II toxin-antitoxin system PemK/MazF family toxin [Methylovulum miyakonense]|uniref:type II toxin-antitoxin system PemK/MazF family toxin n=1 Tax=Methylovulum miyakonense TaxID=645578 RepID=UPI003BB6E6BA
MAKIYFTDLSAYKIRPVLVIKELHDDCMCLQLTAQAKGRGLTLTQQDLLKGGLKKESFVIMPKNFTLHKSILVKYLATLNPERMFDIGREFCLEIGCG